MGRKGIQVGAVQSHSTLEPELERSPPKPPERILSGVQGARTKEISTRYLKGRDPIENSLCGLANRYHGRPVDPGERPVGRGKTGNLKAEGGKRKKESRKVQKKKNQQKMWEK